LAECQAAIGVATAIQCPVFTIFNDSYTYTYAELNTIIGTHCDSAASSCSNMLQNALLNVLDQCFEIIKDVPAVWINIGALLVANKVPCIQDDAQPPHWCFAEFKQFLERLSTSDTNPLTATDLQNGCTNCTAKVLLAWIAFEPSFEAIYSTSTIDIICSRADNEWCILEFQQALTALTGATNQQLIDRAPIYCKTCTFIYLFKWKSLVEYANEHLNHALDEAQRNATNVVYYMGWLCVKDDQTPQNYCNAKLLNYNFDNVGAACNSTGVTLQCAPDCHAAIAQVITDLGCCLDTWLDLMAYNCFVNGCDPKDNPSNIRIMVQTICKLDIPIGCQKRRALAAKVQIENLSWLWCQLHMPQCLQLVHIAIAQQFLLDIADVRNAIAAEHLQRTDPAATPTRRLLQTSGDGDVLVKVGGLSNSIGSVNTANKANSVTVSGTPGDAKASLGTPTTTKVLSATVTGSAAGVMPSLSLALLALLLLFV
jgi:hypothetical protein